MMAERALDLICLGRASVDLYGEQLGGRLEDMASFAKYVGGCPTNVSVGASRLGLKSALITRVGDEHMGRFIRETLIREGVDVSHVKTDPERLTALVILGIRDRDTFPLIFYRTDCADMAIQGTDFDARFIASARALLVTGTHFSTPQVADASLKAMRLAKAAGTRIVLDIDYRPVLWGLTGLGEGEERFVADAAVTARMESIVGDCDLIVGTEEEVRIAGGAGDTVAALRRVRDLSGATLVLKRGPLGCVVFPGAIPDDLDAGIAGEGFRVDIYNVLGAGDAFLSGFLRGWFRGEAIERCCTFANACGAFTVSRHGCAPAIPTWVELSDFLANGSVHYRLRDDTRINHLHWATTRHDEWGQIGAVDFDDDERLETLAARDKPTGGGLAGFKGLIWQAVRQAANRDASAGIVADDGSGQDALFAAAGTGTWIARAIDAADANLAVALREWPVEHVVKCSIAAPPLGGDLLPERLAALAALHEACRATHHELFLTVDAPQGEAPGAADGRAAGVIAAVYGAKVLPDWWGVPPRLDDDAWRAVDDAVTANDPHCRGVLLLLGDEEAGLEHAVRTARAHPICQGFVAGRAIFGDTGEAWFGGAIDDAAAVAAMAERYGWIVRLWRGAAM